MYLIWAKWLTLKIDERGGVFEAHLNHGHSGV